MIKCFGTRWHNNSLKFACNLQPTKRGKQTGNEQGKNHTKINMQIDETINHPAKQTIHLSDPQRPLAVLLQVQHQLTTSTCQGQGAVPQTTFLTVVLDPAGPGRTDHIQLAAVAIEENSHVPARGLVAAGTGDA